MQNSIQNFGQKSIVFKKSGVLYEKLKLLTSFKFPTVQYFLLKLRTRFVLKKGCVGCYFCYLDLSLLAKIKKYLVSKNSFFYTFINSSRSKQNQKNPAQLFAYITTFSVILWILSAWLLTRFDSELVINLALPILTYRM